MHHECESLSRDVAVICNRGGGLAGHHSTGLLIASGMSDWIVSNADASIQCAHSASAGLQRLAALRRALPTSVADGTRGDADRFCRSVSDATMLMIGSGVQSSNADVGARPVTASMSTSAPSGDSPSRER